MNLIKISVTPDDTELCAPERDTRSRTYEERSRCIILIATPLYIMPKSCKENRIDIYKLRASLADCLFNSIIVYHNDQRIPVPL